MGTVEETVNVIELKEQVTFEGFTYPPRRYAVVAGDPVLSRQIAHKAAVKLMADHPDTIRVIVPTATKATEKVMRDLGVDLYDVAASMAEGSKVAASDVRTYAGVAEADGTADD